MVKAIVLADLHTMDEREFIDPAHLRDADFFIIVGDTTATKKYKGYNIGTRKDFKFDKPVIGIFGNHENWDLVKSGKHGVRNLHKKIIRYKGLKFAGVGGVLAKRPRRYYHNSLKDITDWMKYLIKKKKEIDVFVMHEPPVRCFDWIRGRHRGVEEYRVLLKKLKPKMVFVGHMHTYRGSIYWPCGTTIINPGVALRGEYVFIDFDKETAQFCP